MKNLRLIYLPAILILAAALGFSSCAKDDSPDYDAVTGEDRIALTFGVGTSEIEDFQKESDFIQQAFRYENRDLNKTLAAVAKAKFILLYIDATKATSDEQRVEVLQNIKKLWDAGLNTKKDRTLCVLRIGESAPLAEHLAGFDVGAGTYVFGTRSDALTYVDAADISLAELGLRSLTDYIFQDDSGTRSEEMPSECKKSVLRNIQFHFERNDPFDIKDGTLRAGYPASDVEYRSAVVDLTLFYDIYSATGSKDRWISVLAKGGGYKTNIQTRVGKRGDDDGYVLNKTVHTGRAYVGNLIRCFTLESTVEGSNVNLIERLPENEIKDMTISSTKSHEINIAGNIGGSKDGVSGGGDFGYKYNWSSTVAYSQADFEMNNSIQPTNTGYTVFWKTIPRTWFDEKAFEDDNTSSSLDVKQIRYSNIAAGKTPDVFKDFSSSRFPVGFHNMAPQASALYYTTDNTVNVRFKATLELQDSHLYWNSGVCHNNKTDWYKLTPSGEDFMKIKFADSGTIFEDAAGKIIDPLDY